MDSKDSMDMPLASTAGRPGHRDSERAQHVQDLEPPEQPSVPVGMTLDEVLARAAEPPPSDFPLALHDDPVRSFALVEQFEQRFIEEGRDVLGLEAQGWVGKDYNKFWWKLESEAGFDGTDEGEVEIDLLYSRLVAPFWSLQAGVQLASEWQSSESEERWSAVAGVQGVAPGQFELDNALYLSEDGDLTATFEAEFDMRITQRLVLQPRTELQLAAQDVDERALGAGLTDVLFDLRLRYELRRRFAPYVGVRYQTLTGETKNLADGAGGNTEDFALLVGLRLAF
jgi:copper resistance protein B